MKVNGWCRTKRCEKSKERKEYLHTYVVFLKHLQGSRDYPSLPLKRGKGRE